MAKGRERPRKTIGETIKDRDVNGFSIGMICEKISWRRLIHVVDPI